MHDFGVQFIPFKLGNLKKFIEGKKDAAKSAREARYPLMQSKTLKATTRGTLFSRCRLRLCDFSFLRSIISIYKLLFLNFVTIVFSALKLDFVGNVQKRGKISLVEATWQRRRKLVTIPWYTEIWFERAFYSRFILVYVKNRYELWRS